MINFDEKYSPILKKAVEDLKNSWHVALHNIILKKQIQTNGDLKNDSHKHRDRKGFD